MTTEVNDLLAKIVIGNEDLDRLHSAVNDPAGTYTDANGDVVKNLRQRLDAVGYDVPVAFTSGISVSAPTKTVTYSGQVYAADPASVPFTTTSMFDDTQWVLVHREPDTNRVFTATYGTSGDGSSDNLSKIHAALAASDTVVISTVDAQSVVGISDTVNVPANKTLVIPRGIHLKLLATGSNNATSVVEQGEGSTVEGDGRLDANLLAREASGELTAGYTFGSIMENVSNCTLNVREIADVGATDPYIASSLPNGGGVLINMTASATAHVTGNRVLRGQIVDSLKHGFMARIRSDFVGIAEGELSYYCQHNTIEGVRGPGGNKNSVECVGPHTRFNEVKNCQAVDPTGQAGFEADFGSYGNYFRKNSVLFTGTISRTFSGFNEVFQHVTPDDGKPKYTRDNVFEDCAIYGGELTSTFSIRGFNVIGGSKGVKFIRPVMQGQTVGSGSGDIIGGFIEPQKGYADNITYEKPTFLDCTRPFKIFGPNFGMGLLRVSGGTVNYSDKLMDSGLTDVLKVHFHRVRVEGTKAALVGYLEKCVEVTHCHFVGQTETTLRAQNVTDGVFIYGGNTFECGTSSGFPISQPADAAFMIDRGGNVFTSRVPVAALSATNGRLVASSENHTIDTTLWSSGLQRCRAYSDAEPTVGNFNQGDILLDPGPTSGARTELHCVGSGTYGTLTGVTADTTSGNATIVVSDASDLKINQWITVTGAVTAGRIASISGLNVTLHTSAAVTATVAGAATSYKTATWQKTAALAP